MAITLNQVSFHYKPGEDILSNVSVTFPESGFLVLMGKSGCGKSTLLSLLSGILPPKSGTISGMKKEDIAFLFQSPLLLDYLNVEDNIALPLLTHGSSKKKLTEAISTCLRRVGLEGFQQRDVKTLSGGEQVRVSFARALIQQKSILLLDEVTGQLDEKTSLEIYQMLKGLSKDHLVILVTHDTKNACNYADVLYEFHEKTLVEIYNHKEESKLRRKDPSQDIPKDSPMMKKECERILQRFLKGKRLRVYSSCLFLALELSLTYLGLIFESNLNRFTDQILQSHYGYQTAKIKQVEKVNTGTSISLERFSIPEDQILKDLNIQTYYPSLNYFFPETYNLDYQQRSATVTFIPVFNDLPDTSDVYYLDVTINDLFKIEFGLDEQKETYQPFAVEKETFFSIPDTNLFDIIECDVTCKIQGVSPEKNLFNKPILYYNYFQLRQILYRQKLSNLSAERKEECYLSEFFDLEKYRDQDFLSHELYLSTPDPFLLDKTIQSRYAEKIVLDSNVLSIRKSTSEITSLTLKVIFAFLILNIISAFLLEFLSITSLYEDNLRFFALLKVFHASKKTMGHFISTFSEFFFLRTFFSMLLFTLTIAFLSNYILHLLSYPIFFSFFSLPYLLLLFLLLSLLSYLSSLLPLRHIKEERIKQELEGED